MNADQKDCAGKIIRDILFDGLGNVDIDIRIIDSAVDSLLRVITPEIIIEGIHSFVRASRIGEKQKLEALLLTAYNQIISLDYSMEERSLVMGFIYAGTDVKIKTYYPGKGSEFTSVNNPYRVELQINSGQFNYSYGAEGDRRQVKTLLDFSYKCASVVTSSLELDRRITKKEAGL